MRFSMILEMVDRLSAPARRARAGVGGLANTARQMGQRVRQAAGELQRGERTLSGFARTARRAATVSIGRMLQDAARRARQLDRNLAALVTRLRLVERAGFATGRGLRKLGGMAFGGLQIAGAAAGGASIFAAFDMIRTTGQFEQYQVMLEGIEGSAAAARKSMAWVQEFTQKTPFELGQVMEAFVALKAYGIDPMNGSLTALGDASAGMSKPLMQAIEAMADATTGEFERLKEFGIRASKEGNRVAFTFRKNGKDIRREANFTGAAIEEALVGIFNDRFGGGMQRQSQTLFGIISNLRDKWTGFQLSVGEAGIFATVKKDLEALLKDVDAMTANGELTAWAKDISDGLEDAWSWGKKFVEETDWRAVGKGLATAVEALVSIVTLLGRAAQIADDIASGEAAKIKSERSLPQKPSDPWTLFRFKDQPSSEPDFKQPRTSRLPKGLKTSSAGSVNVGGALKIDVSSAPGLAVRATPVSAPGPNLPIEVRTGRTMRSAA